MAWEPKNRNLKLPNRHTLYLATSGGGKSQALGQNPEIPKAGARVILWDHAGDHPGLHYRSRVRFLTALDAANRSGGGFRIAYAGERSPEAFEWFMNVCWRMLDGNKLTYVLAEELSAVCTSTAKASPNAARFLNESRKFGGIFHGTSQKPQEVSKTYYDQCGLKFIGQQKGLAMRKRMAMEIGVAPTDIAALEQLEFYRDDGSAKDPELIRLAFKEPQGVRFMD